MFYLQLACQAQVIDRYDRLPHLEYFSSESIYHINLSPELHKQVEGKTVSMCYSNITMSYILLQQAQLANIK